MLLFSRGVKSLAVLTSVAIAAFGGMVGCEDSAATRAQIGVSVQSPSTSAVADISEANVSKSVAKSEGVALAESADLAEISIGAGVDVTLTRYDTGEVVGTGETDRMGAAVIMVDPDKANGKDLLLTADKGDGVIFQKLLTETVATVGQRTDAGTINSESTVVVEQVVRSCEKALGVSVLTSDMSACATAQTAGTMAPPKSLVKIYEGMFAKSGTAGTDSELGVLLANKKAFDNAVARGLPRPRDFLNKLFEGDAAALIQASSYTNLTMDAAMISKYVDDAVVGKNDIFKDADTYKKYNESGQWTKASDLWASGDPSSIKSNPAFYKNQFETAADNYKAGETTAFDFMSNDPKLLAEIGGQCAGVVTISSAEQSAASSKYFTQVIAQGKNDAATRTQLAQAACKTMASAVDDSTKLTLLKNDPHTYAGSTVNNPGALTGSTGATVITNMFTAGNQLGQATRPCASSSECASGQLCTPQYFCASSTVSCTSNCALGNACSGDANCATGLCSNNFCAMSSTADPLSARRQGGVCTANAGCASGQCTSGVCAVPVVAGGTTTPPSEPPPTIPTVPPLVSSVSGFASGTSSAASIAASGTTGISGKTSKPLTVTFDKAMTANTVNAGSVTLLGSGGPVVAIQPTSGANTSFTVTPSVDLAQMTDYLLTVGTDVQSSAGAAMSSAATYTYTTGCATNDTFENSATLSTATTQCWTTSNSSNASVFAIQNGVLDMRVGADTETAYNTAPRAQKSFPNNTSMIQITTKLTFAGIDGSQGNSNCALTLADSGLGLDTKSVRLVVSQPRFQTLNVRAHALPTAASTNALPVGAPVVYLRLLLSGGTITASYSEDNATYVDLVPSGDPFLFSNPTGAILVHLLTDHASGDPASCQWDDFTVTSATATGQD